MGEVSAERPPRPVPAGQEDVMQYTADGHVLGFAPGKVYMVGMGYALTEEFVGAQRVMPVPKSSAESGSLHGSDEMLAGASSFQGVCYPELWEGISLRYEKASGALAETVYSIQPGAEVKDIRLRYNADFKIGNDGSLRFRHPTKKGYFTLSRPVAWQEMGGQRIPVEVAFKARGQKTLGFRVGARDPDIPLFIDPVYQWHTFYGSPENDRSEAIAVTGDGVYVVGYSHTAWNGDGDTPPLHSHAGGGESDIVILKLDTDGAYQWHTFYGSTDNDRGHGIAVTGDGVYVTGRSDAAWNGDGNTPPLHPHGWGAAILVMKLDTGGAYQWHTFYVGSGRDIAATSDGVYVTGMGPGSWNGDGNTPPLHSHAAGIDIVILKLDAGGAYQWHTFYGGTNTDFGYGIAAAGEGVYVTGESDAAWNGDGDAPAVHSHAGGGNPDMVILKLGTEGAYQWHTFYGSTDRDIGYGIAAAAGGGAYVVGSSDAAWNGDGDTPPVHSHAGGGNPDMVILKLGTEGGYQWHTFYGNENYDFGLGIAASMDGVHVTGASHGAWNGDGGSPPLHPHFGGPDITILKLGTEGGYQWHTFHGGLLDYGQAIAVTSSEIYVAAVSNASWPADEDPNIVPLHSHTGNNDIAVLQISATSYVVYHPNGATAGDPPLDPNLYKQGETVTVFGNTGGLVQGGHVFIGWNTEADGTGTSYEPGGTFSMPAAGVTLYAQYSQAIPTLSEWGMILLSLLMAAAAVACLRKREKMVS
jgi:hypothetical protein